jgi:hypothetical protein
MALPAVMALRLRPALHEFEAGLARVSFYRRRVTVVRWADLAAVSEDIGTDQDGDEHFHGYLLHDHAGNTVEIPGRRRALSRLPAARPRGQHGGNRQARPRAARPGQADSRRPPRPARSLTASRRPARSVDRRPDPRLPDSADLGAMHGDVAWGRRVVPSGRPGASRVVPPDQLAIASDRGGTHGRAKRRIAESECLLS